MTELIKQEASLAVLKVRLLDSIASAAPASGSAPTANQTLTPNQRIFCELQVTGQAEERGFVAPTTELPNLAPSRSRRNANRPMPNTPEANTANILSRTLAQWSFAPDEMQLPVDYDAVLRFRDKPNPVAGWLADAARFTVFKCLADFRADSLERFASGKYWLPSGKPMLPTTMTRQLQALLPSVLRDGDSLWLELAEPAGYLPLLPWEEMLRPVTRVPILRLSPHVVQALSPDRELSVVLCLSMPSSTWTPTPKQLASLMSAIRGALPEHSTLHVFADDVCQPLTGVARGQISTDDSKGRAIKLYDLPRVGSDKGPREESWKAWVAESLEGSAADILHTMMPARPYADQARLVISHDPWPSAECSKDSVVGRPLRYVTPLELSTALTQLGAWAAVFSTPTRGSWLAEARLGLRLLADQIGRLRPGVVAVHDFEADTDGKALAETYAFIIGQPSTPASTSPAVAVYCHPGRAAAVAPQPTSLSVDLAQQYLKVKETIQAVMARSGPTPAWVASTQRIVEQAMSRAVGQEGRDDQAVTLGLVAALKAVEQILGEPPRAAAPSEGMPSRAPTGGATSA
jgi:hypothetical protein